MGTQALRDLYGPHKRLEDLYPDTQYDPKTGKVTVGDHTFEKAQIPGTMFDTQGYHHVYDQDALSKALGGDTQKDGWRRKGESPPEVAPGTGVPEVPPQIQSQVTDYLQRHGLDQHRQQLESLLAEMPQWERMTEEDRLEAARRDAGLQVDPHLAALERALEREQQALDAQLEYAEAAHAGYKADVDYAMGQAMDEAIESSIARGGGRGGLTDWTATQLQQPIIGASERAAADHQARLNDIASQKALAERQYNDSMIELEQRRGELEASLMEKYAERDHAMMAQDWERAFNANMQLEQMEEERHQFDTQMAHAHAEFQENQRQFDTQMAQAQAEFEESQRQFDTQAELARAEYMEHQRQFDTSMDFKEAQFFQDQENIEKDRVLEEARVFGEMGGESIGAREYVERHGGTIDWKRADDGGDIVIINGEPIHVQAAGGSNVGGTIQLPEEVLEYALF